MSTPPSEEPLIPEVPREPTEAGDEARPIDASPTPFASEPIGITPGRMLVTPESIAAEPALAIAGANEPTVADVAPLAVAGPTTVERIAPIVVKTRTGPVALESQPPAPTVARPAPIAIREAVAVPVIVPKPARLASLDIFRGLTIAMMILANNQTGEDSTHYAWLNHAEWNGWTPTDLIFPFFLFIVGVATPFSLGKRAALEGASTGTLLARIWLRALSLGLLGLLLAGTELPLPFYNVPHDGFWFTKAFRAFGFGFAYVGILALLVPWRSRQIAAIVPLAIAAILVGYGIAMHFVRAKAIANGWPEKPFGTTGLFDPDHLRIPGVLMRIGVCYGIAASIALIAGRKTVWLAILVLFGLYSWMMLAVPFGGHTVGSLTKADNFANSVDVAVLQRSHAEDGHTVFTQDHAYGEYVDNEGLVSTLPAIGTALIGVLAGWWLRRADRTPAEKCAGLLARGVVVTCVGVLLSEWLMPINKNLWTPSFSVFTAGLAMLALGTIFWTIDVRLKRWWAWPFKVLGMNAIAAYVASTVVVRVAKFIHVPDPLGGPDRIGPSDWLNRTLTMRLHEASDHLAQLHAGFPVLATPQNESLAYALAFVCVIFALMLVLYVCRISVKV